MQRLLNSDRLGTNEMDAFPHCNLRPRLICCFKHCLSPGMAPTGNCPALEESLWQYCSALSSWSASNELKSLEEGAPSETWVMSEPTRSSFWVSRFMHPACMNPRASDNIHPRIRRWLEKNDRNPEGVRFLKEFGLLMIFLKCLPTNSLQSKSLHF